MEEGAVRDVARCGGDLDLHQVEESAIGAAGCCCRSRCCACAGAAVAARYRDASHAQGEPDLHSCRRRRPAVSLAAAAGWGRARAGGGRINMGLWVRSGCNRTRTRMGTGSRAVAWIAAGRFASERVASS